MQKRKPATNVTEPQPLETSVELAVVSGLTPGAKLRENRLIRMTPTGVEFQGEMNIDQWQDGMKFLRWMKSASTLWLADFITTGEKLFGKEVVQDCLVQLEFDLMDAQRALAVGSLDRRTRLPELTTEHYWVLAQAKLTPGKQTHWAAQAVQHKLTAHLLARSIAEGKVIGRAEHSRNTGRSSGLATPHGIRQSFDLWWRQVEENEPLHTWEPARKRELLEELKPVAKIVRELESELGDNE